jgi:hypothetical protein
MKVRFKTQVSKGKGTLPAGAVHDLPEDQAKAYIARGLAVACEDDDALTETEKTALAAEKKAAAERAKAEKAAKKAAEGQAGGSPQEGGAQ